jgi:hypothetical protein
VTPRPLSTPGKDPVPIVQEAGWAPEPVWTCAENLARTWIRSPYRPARSSVAIPTELPGPHRGSSSIFTNAFLDLPQHVSASHCHHQGVNPRPPDHGNDLLKHVGVNPEMH